MRKKILSFLSIFLVMVLVNTRVYANSIAEAGDTVNQEGEYDSIRLVAGNKVTSTARIDGLSLIAGNEVIVSGTNTYGFYAGNSILISSNITKDLFVAGNKIVIQKEAVIGRDVFILGSDVTVMSDVARDLRIGAEAVNLSGITINGDACIMADNIKMDEGTVILGKLTYPEDANVIGIDKAKVMDIEKTKSKEIVVNVNYYDSIVSFIISVCAAYIVLLVLFYLLPNTKNKLDKLELKADMIFKNMGIGFLVLICVPLVFIITIFTSILTPLALILGCVYVVAIYLASLLTAYFIGNTLNKKIFKNDSKYLALLIGIILVRLVKLIPSIGPFLGFICLIYGMGLIFKYISSRK